MMMLKGELVPVGTGKLTPEFVLKVAAHGFGVTLEDLRNHNRGRPLVRYRQVTMAAVRRMTDESYPAMGRLFDRDHTTVMHAVVRAETDDAMRSTVDALCNAVQREWDEKIRRGAGLVEFS